jgi:lipopolysaccharide/colanic/teichoic acid biosynthesis glycosyltransferase
METTGGFSSNIICKGIQTGSLAGLGLRETVYYYTKRCFDTVVAAILLILLAPLLLVIAILIRLDSPGPVIFSQTRVGCKYRRSGGRMKKEPCTFTFYKFRSMKYKADSGCHREFIEAYIRNDTEKMKSLQKGPSDGGNLYKLNGDSRITRIGKYLRKTSLDELPQLWNVIKGEMSLVGPRPAIPYEVEMYERRHIKRLYALPGITGLWQVKGRNSVSFEDMVTLDIEYVDNRSFWLDIKILVLTPLAVLSKKCS